MKKNSKIRIIRTLILFILFIAVILIVYNLLEKSKEMRIQNKVTEVINSYNNEGIVFADNNREKFYKYPEAGIKITANPDTYTYISEHLNEDIDINSVPVSFTDEGLYAFLLSEDKKGLDNTTGSVSVNDNGLFLISGVQGNRFEAGRVLVDIKNNLSPDGEYIELSNYYRPVDNSNAEELIDRVNKWHISYTNGFSINVKDMIPFIHVEKKNNKNTLLLTEGEELFNYLDKKIELGLLDYDTVGKGKEFITHTGEKITVQGGTWGDIQDSDKETEYVIEAFKSLSSYDDRYPFMSQEYGNLNTEEYIEVSKDEQHLWYYKDGEVVMESDVVTGRLDRSTPTGTYYISEKVKEKDLRGPGYVSHVHRWMRLTGNGVGLHDATWRGRFGGNIYRSSGSHGCINLPKDFAYNLYDNVETGTCVIVY